MYTTYLVSARILRQPTALDHGKESYSTTECEALGMIYSITKFRHYLLGRKFTFHVDHSALLYLVNKQIPHRSIGSMDAPTPGI